jgi:hypothetical protein
MSAPTLRYTRKGAGRYVTTAGAFRAIVVRTAPGEWFYDVQTFGRPQDHGLAPTMAEARRLVQSTADALPFLFAESAASGARIRAGIARKAGR